MGKTYQNKSGVVLDSSEIKIKDLFVIISRRKYTIVFTCFVTIIVAFLYLFLADEIYESDCKLLLVDDQNANAFTDFALSDFMMQSFGKSDPIVTQIEILKTRPILAEVVKRCNTRNENGTPILLADFRKKFEFKQVKATNIIEISCRDKDRIKAALYANTLAQVFAEQNQHLNKEAVRNAKDFLEKQLKMQKQKVTEAEQLVMKFKTNSKTVSLEQETSARVNALAGLEAERIKLETELKGLQAQKKEIENRLSNSNSQAAPHYTSLDAAKEQISISATNITARLREIKGQLNVQYKSMKDLPPLEIQLARLMREERIMNEIYTNLLSKYEEYKIREAARVASIKIIEPAVPTDFPVLPPRKKGLVLACFAGLLISFSLALILELTKDRPYDIEEIKRILHTDAIGYIPDIEKDSQLFMHDNPNSLASEAMRLLHANLKFKSVVQNKCATIMVTSAQPAEGKSTIAVNLGIAFANTGKKTALINLDLRRPTFSKMLRHNFNIGITNYLIGEATYEQTYWLTDFNENLTIYPSGKIPPNPTELIASPKMTTFIEKIRETYDVLIFDSAPITMVAETLDIARVMDGIVLVADHSGTSRRRLGVMYDMLKGKQLPVLGVVINKMRQKNKEKNYYRYVEQYS